MNSSDSHSTEARRQALLGQLRAAESALRGGLHTHRLTGSVRDHLERALAHLLEAHIAISESRTIRTVPQLAEDLARIHQVCEELRQQPPPGVTVKSLRL